MQNEIRNAETTGSEKIVREEGLSWRRPIMLLAVLGVAGLAFSTATAWLLPLFSEYALIGDNISELAIGRYGYVQTAAFFAAGVGSLAIAVGICLTTSGSWSSRVGSVLVGLWGAGAVLAAIFPTDRIDNPEDLLSLTTVGTIHIVVALLAFVCGIASMFVLSGTFKRDARWRALWPVSVALAFAALVVFFLQSEGPWVGLYQRMYVGTITLWLILVAFRLRSFAKGTSAGQLAQVEGARMSELAWPVQGHRPRKGSS